jgi:hypothetical protein
VPVSIGSLPNEGEWPCQTEPKGDLPPRLVDALYVLLRDYVQPGDLEQLMIFKTSTEPSEYTNKHLEGYARSLATYLLADA